MKNARTSRQRLLLVLGGALAWAVVIFLRMVQVQVYRAEDLRELATRQQSSIVELDPVRGAILDREGVELAITRDVKSVFAVPGLVQAPDKAAQALAKTLKMDRKKVLARLRMKDRNFIWIKRKLTDSEAAAVTALGLTGIELVPEPKRFYPQGTLAAHLLGGVGLDNNGLAGIEQLFDEDIRGIPGVKLTLRDARGVRFLPEPRGHPAEAGRNVVLTIDARIQYVLERELKAAMEENQAKGAVGIVLDPYTGDVLAMAAEPTFDPNEFAKASAAVRRNPAVQEAYEPGSTFKMVTFSAALEGHRIRPGESIDCGHGSIQLQGARVTDHQAFDQLTPTEIFAHSSNVGTITISQRIPTDDFYRQVRLYGFGRPTGIELPGEAAGLLRDPRDWSGLSKPMMSMGYEIAVTPIQLASVFAAIANGGTLVKPRLVLRVEAEDGSVVRAIDAQAVRRAISPETRGALVAMMQEVVRDGTAKAAAIEGLVVAGKTGTAKKLVDGQYTSGHYVASFGAFAPAGEPRAVVLVAIDEPRGSEYYGGLVAAPVVKRVLEPTLALLGVPAEGRTVEGTVEDHFPDPVPGAPGRTVEVVVARR